MVIFINGSINAGKSTVAKGLAQRLENTALVEIDTLGAFIDWVEIDKAVPINLENALLVIRNLIKHGFNVIVPYPLSERNYRSMLGGLEDLQERILVFTLAPRLEKALRQTADRQLSEWELARIKHHYEIGIPNPSFGTVIDTTEQAPAETIEQVYQAILSSK